MYINLTYVSSAVVCSLFPQKVNFCQHSFYKICTTNMDQILLLKKFLFFPVTKAKNKLLEYHKDRFQLLAITITIHSSSNSTVGQKSNKRFWKLITFFPSLVWFLMSFSFSIWVNDIKTLATIYDYFFLSPYNCKNKYCSQ